MIRPAARAWTVGALAASILLGLLSAVRAQDVPAPGPAAPPPAKGADPQQPDAPPPPAPKRSFGLGRPTLLTLSADGSRIAAGSKGLVVVWDVGAAAPLAARAHLRTDIQEISLSRDGTHLVVMNVSDRRSAEQRWRGEAYEARSFRIGAKSLEPGPDFAWHTPEGTAPGFGPYYLALRSARWIGAAGGVVVVRPDRVAEVRDAAKGDVLRTIGIDQDTDDLDVRFDGEGVVGRTLFDVWLLDGPDARTRWRVRLEPARPQDRANSTDVGRVRFSYDGSAVLCAASFTRDAGRMPEDQTWTHVVLCLDPSTGVERWRMVDAEWIGDPSPKAPWIVLRKDNGTGVYDIGTRALTCRIGAAQEKVSAAAFSPDGRHLWYARDKDGEILRFDLPKRAPK